MAPKQQNEDDSGSMLKLLLDSVEDLDLSVEGQNDPKALLVQDFEISKLFAIIEFALSNGADKSDEGILAGLNMMSREEAIKTINGVFLFNVKSSKEAGKTQSFFVDMRKTGSLTLGKGPPKPKPDVILTVNDRDMVALATGKMNPQMAFMKGKIKVKGNIMLGLRMQQQLMKEIGKLSKL